MPLLSVRPQFKPISLQTNLNPPFFAFCSPHPASLTQLDSGFNIQFLEIQFLRCPEGIEYSRHRAVHPRHQCRGFSRWIGKLAQKCQLFKRMAEILAENPGLWPQDLVINLVEVAWENWSFGNGEAQYTV
jgi:hypothetical protein